MPQDLKDHITKLPAIERSQIWVSCVGEHDVDREAVGQIEYIPRGFPSYFYPFTTKPGYLSPLVAVRFTRPKGEIFFQEFLIQLLYIITIFNLKFLTLSFSHISVNQIINIECRSWAKNIMYQGGSLDRKGSVHFELMIDAV